MKNKKIDLIIVGAQKAGTTSLNNYLHSHPSISGHEAIEFSFFSDPKEYKEGFDHAYHRYFNTGNQPITVAKNATLALHQDALHRLRKHNPHVKIVFLLREPVSRAYSAYNMAVKNGWMSRPFSDFKEILHQREYHDIMYRHFIAHGFYAQQIRNVLQYFPKNQLKIYLFEDLKETPQKICNDIFDWLQLPSSLIKEEIHNPTFKPRSQKLGGILDSIRQNDNLLKRFTKSFLPYSTFKTIGNLMLNLNKSKERFCPIDLEMEALLQQHFEDYNQALRMLIEQLPPSCLTLYQQDIWLEDVALVK